MDSCSRILIIGGDLTESPWRLLFVICQIKFSLENYKFIPAEKLENSESDKNEIHLFENSISCHILSGKMELLNTKLKILHYISFV